jgi:hypothetical protein
VEFTKNSAVERFCRDALAEHARLFRLCHKFRSGQIDRGPLLLRSIPIQKRIFALAERHLDSPHREVRNLATALFDHNERLFTFLEREALSPPITAPNERSARPSNGGKSVSATAAPKVSWPRRVY